MSYIFKLNNARIVVPTTDPEDWAVATVSGRGAAAMSRALSNAYGAMGNTINLASVTANDIDAALTSMSTKYSLSQTDGSADIDYPSGVEA
jgi:hypothetical protein